jgi:hypothetical protein
MTTEAPVHSRSTSSRIGIPFEIHMFHSLMVYEPPVKWETFDERGVAPCGTPTRR